MGVQDHRLEVSKSQPTFSPIINYTEMKIEPIYKRYKKVLKKREDNI